MEKFGNGYKGRAATRRQMHANFRGFADHSPRSLKPVHGEPAGVSTGVSTGRPVGGFIGASVWRDREKGDSHMTEQASLTEQIIRPSVEEIHASIPHKGVREGSV
jgi:hypothetical protein